MLLYDHLLCFDDEVALIWKARWTIPKTLYLLLRYVVPICIAIHLHRTFGSLDPTLQDELIFKFHTELSGISHAGLSDSVILVILHLWNIWERKRGFILSTLVLFILTQIAGLTCAVIVVKKFLSEP
ncbi:hypothetical protein Moror_6732 [Moniliophthora roreri MCA 2997]|uniref:DUF6533 domain-containing protein n=1 Tax=Moniliophthora roreri (strain MCA 2997) TaxID=1381753 RepID=V2XVZ9_MONRO|nr:hypothetical protein Moror_6732 [Moniliophthora roreri MCA 2997]